MNLSFEKIFGIIKKNLLVIIAVALLFFGCAFAYMKLLVAPVYYTNAKITIEDTRIDTGTTQGINVQKAQTETFIVLLDSHSFFQRVHENLPDELKDKISADAIYSGTSFSRIGETEVIRVTFSSGNNDLVKPVTETIIRTVQDHLQSAFGACSCRVADPPYRNYVSSNKTTVVCIIATVLGALSVIVLLVVRDMLDVRIRTASDLAKRYNVPILGSVPEFDSSKMKKKEGPENGKKQ